MSRPRMSREQHKYGHLWPQVQVDPCNRWLLDEYAWNIWMSRGKLYVVGTDKINGRFVMRRLHRVIMNAPSGVEVDHINGDTLDNRRCNLRLCTCAENQHNQKPRGGSSEFKGVCWRKQRRKWSAQIRVNGKLIHLGFFDDEVEAARAYDAAARRQFSEFAKTNF